VNLAADMPGWVRYKPAAEWLAAHRNQAVSANPDSTSTASLSPTELRQAFEKFMQTYASSAGGKVLTTKEREILFARFMKSLADSKGEQASAR